ncbi:MAG: PAS domain-containing sensor histidine kinase [Chitinophagaceae bacterium]|nr:MAG: PAS domain-containing sensor histidine kinase [Chitinophagaceae bacterium]
MNLTHSSTSISPALSDLLNDCSIDRVMAINCEWEIIAWNATSELLTGLNRQDVLGKQLTEVFPSITNDLEMRAAIESAFGGYKTYLPSAAGRFNRHNIENHFIPLKDGRRVVAVMNIMHDVAHRIKAETQLQNLNSALAEKYSQLEKLSEELTSFTSITTDNIREPLQYIYTSLELIMKSEGRVLGDSSKANLRRMQVSLNRINRLIEDITELFRINSAIQTNVPVDLNIILEKVKQAFQRKISERNVTITCTELPEVKGIAEMLQLLFQNLIDNSIKFRHEERSPVIEITSSVVILNKDIAGHDVKGNKHFCVSFKDNGIGIPAEHLQKIFTMFVQLNDKKKYPGSGLGLTFSRKIMDTHKGFITVSSNVDLGTTFNCYFPIQ